MQKISFNIPVQFDVVLSPDFAQVIERIKTGFDAAEEEAEDGIIPARRRGQPVDKRMKIISDVAEAELHASDALKAKLSSLISKAIERRCEAHIVFANVSEQLTNDGRYAALFDLTFVTLLD